MTLANCNSLKKITFGEGFTKYSSNEFINAYFLDEIYFKSQTPPRHDTASGSKTLFETLGANAKIYVPAASVDEYKAAPAFSNFVDIIVGY